MDLRVLGTVQTFAAGRLIELRPVERRLMAALAVCWPDAGRYDALAEAVWGDATPPSATRSLQTHVLRVRSATGSDVVETVSGGYRLGATVSLDVIAFTTLFRAADATDDRRAAVAAWDETLALWRGVPFEEIDDWPPAIAERARLTEMWQRGLEERCAAALGVVAAAEVVAEAERLVQAEPLRERRWSLLLSSLDAAGRRAEALRAFDRARRVLATELGISPGHELARLHETLLRDGDHDDDARLAPLRSGRPHGNLPAALTTIIGREQHIEQIVEMLETARLVTLTGAGGIGKTRLAVAIGEAMCDEVSGGVWIVELARTHEPDAVNALIASALGLATAGPDTVRDIVLAGIGDRQLLLVLDNCEHVLGSVTGFIVEALGRCRGLRVLTTSREPLAVPGEHTMVVPSLAVDGAAAELFVARAQDADPAFAADDIASLTAITRHLDGIPLAIELAAARVRTIGLVELVRQLDERSDLMVSHGGGRDRRHRTMRAALDWSYELLSEAERRTFEQLSVFHGRFELDAVPQVVAGIAADEDVTEVLASLVDKSMVVADRADPARFRMLEPLRQYAAGRLSRAGGAELVASRHARYFAEVATLLADQLGGRDEVVAAHRIDAARDNLRAAFRTASRNSDVADALAICVALTGYARTRIWNEPWSWCEEALTLPGIADHPSHPDALVGASVGAWQLGDHTRSLELAEVAIALAEPGSPAWRDAHVSKSEALIWLGRVEDAVTAATAASQPSDVSDRTVYRLGVLGLILNLAGRPDPTLAQRLLDMARTLDNPTALAFAFHVAGVIVNRNQPALCSQYQRRSAELSAATGAVLIHGFALAVLAAQRTDDPVHSARAQLDVLNHYLRVGNRTHLRAFARELLIPLITVRANEAAAVVDGATTDQPDLAELAAGRSTPIAQAREALGDDYAAAAARGAALTDDELVAYLDDTITELETASTELTDHDRHR